MAKSTTKTAAPAAAKAAPADKGATGFNKLMKPSKELAAVVGAEPLPRAQVVTKLWDYIKKHNLQNPANKREIVADATLKKVFNADKVTMFEMNKVIGPHLS